MVSAKSKIIASRRTDSIGNERKAQRKSSIPCGSGAILYGTELVLYGSKPIPNGMIDSLREL